MPAASYDKNGLIYGLSVAFHPLKNGANGRATMQEGAAGASEKSPPLTVDFEGVKNASKPSERPFKSCKLSLSNDMLWSDPYTRKLVIPDR